MLKFIKREGKVEALRNNIERRCLCLYTQAFDGKSWLPQFQTCRITSDEIRQCADKLDELNKS